MTVYCEHCGSSLSDDYARVLGDHEGVVQACLHCPDRTTSSASAGGWEHASGTTGTVETDGGGGHVSTQETRAEPGRVPAEVTIDQKEHATLIDGEADHGRIRFSAQVQDSEGLKDEKQVVAAFREAFSDL